MKESKSSKTNIWDVFLAFVVGFFITVMCTMFALGPDLTDIVRELIR